jgi:hypothetical protein
MDRIIDTLSTQFTLSTLFKLSTPTGHAVTVARRVRFVRRDRCRLRVRNGVARDPSRALRRGRERIGHQRCDGGRGGQELRERRESACVRASGVCPGSCRSSHFPKRASRTLIGFPVEGRQAGF